MKSGGTARQASRAAFRASAGLISVTACALVAAGSWDTAAAAPAGKVAAGKAAVDDGGVFGATQHKRIDLPADEVTRLLEQAASAEYAQRQDAAEQLARAGASAVPVLEAAALAGPVEKSLVAIAALEQIFVRQDDETAYAAEQALDRLAHGESSLASIEAHAVLRGNFQLREKRAAEAIEQLGAEVIWDLDERLISGYQRAIYAARLEGGQFAIEDLPTRIQQIRMGKSWTGEIEDLEHFRRLKHLDDLTIFCTTACKLPPEALFNLAADLPGLQVEHRSAASLGISSTQETPLEVMTVRPGMAAERAGLQAGDFILALGGEPTPNFATLVDVLKKYEPGDEVKVRIRRRGNEFDVPVVLTDWSQVDLFPTR